MRHIAFLWSRLPNYAARCIRSLIDREKYSVTVIGTPPYVPIEGMESSLGQKIIWIDPKDTRNSWNAWDTGVPDVAFIGGYSTPAFNALANDCRGLGGSVVFMCDHNWHGSLRQRLIDPLRHRLIFRSRFDGIFVPGASGIRFAGKMGYPPERTVTGLYGADPALFNGGPPLVEREKVIVFVGRFIARKNCIGLAHAFLRFVAEYPEWRLRLIGVGPQRDDIPDHPSIMVEDFAQPTRMAEIFREARCLALPSLDEHWGLVVHEAALSGCALALTDVVGAAADLATPLNAVTFSANDEAAIERELRAIAGWDAAQWQTAEQTSRRLAAGFGPESFADGVERLVALVRAE